MEYDQKNFKNELFHLLSTHEKIFFWLTWKAKTKNPFLGANKKERKISKCFKTAFKYYSSNKIFQKKKQNCPGYLMFYFTMLSNDNHFAENIYFFTQRCLTIDRTSFVGILEFGNHYTRSNRNIFVNYDTYTLDWIFFCCLDEFTKWSNQIFLHVLFYDPSYLWLFSIFSKNLTKKHVIDFERKYDISCHFIPSKTFEIIVDNHYNNYFSFDKIKLLSLLSILRQGIIKEIFTRTPKMIGYVKSTLLNFTPEKTFFRNKCENRMYFNTKYQDQVAYPFFYQIDKKYWKSRLMRNHKIVLKNISRDCYHFFFFLKLNKRVWDQIFCLFFHKKIKLDFKISPRNDFKYRYFVNLIYSLIDTKIDFIYQLEKITGTQIRILLILLFSFFTNFFKNKTLKFSKRFLRSNSFDMLIRYGKNIFFPIYNSWFLFHFTIKNIVKFCKNFKLTKKVKLLMHPIFYIIFQKKENFVFFNTMAEKFLFLTRICFPNSFKIILKRPCKSFFDKTEYDVLQLKSVFNIKKIKKFLLTKQEGFRKNKDCFEQKEQENRFVYNNVNIEFFKNVGMFFNFFNKKGEKLNFVKDLICATKSIVEINMLANNKYFCNVSFDFFITISIFRSCRFSSRIFFLKNNKVKNLIWCYTYSAFLLKVCGLFCRKGKNFFFFLTFYENSVIICLNRHSFVLYDCIVFLLENSNQNILTQIKFLEKIHLIKCNPIEHNISKMVCMLEKNFRPKKQIIRSYQWIEEIFSKKKIDSEIKENNDHSNIVQATLVKSLKNEYAKMPEILISRTKKYIKKNFVDVRGVKITIEDLCRKGFISFSKENGSLEYLPG